MHYKHWNLFFGHVKKIKILGWTPYPGAGFTPTPQPVWLGWWEFPHQPMQWLHELVDFWLYISNLSLFLNFMCLSECNYIQPWRDTTICLVNTNEAVQLSGADIVGSGGNRTTCFVVILVNSCPVITPSAPWNSTGRNSPHMDYSIAPNSFPTLGVTLCIKANCCVDFCSP